MFNREGTFEVTIKQAGTAKSKFCQDPGAFDVVLQVATEDGQVDWWRGEVSTKYGIGNSSNKTRAQLTMETLQKIGLREGQLHYLSELVGKETMATISATESKGKVYYNVKYLGDGYAPEFIDINQASQMLQQMMSDGNGFQQPAPMANQAQNQFIQPAQPVPSQDQNPFIKS